LAKRTPSTRWTKREDALICRLRSNGCDPDEIAGKLPHRTPIAVRRRCVILMNAGRFASLRVPWTPEEDALLCELRAAGASAADLQAQLKSRTPGAIAARVQQLRLEGRFNGKPVLPKPRRPWTEQEESILIRMRSRNAKVHAIAAKLPHRTPRAVEDRVRELIEADEVKRTANGPRSHQRWSPEEDLLVETMRAAKKTEQEIATALDRSLSSVSGRIAQRIRKGELALVRPIVRKTQPRRSR
jgi:hypothetical protein